MKRIVLRVVGFVLLAMIATAVFVFVRSESALRSTWRIDEAALPIPADPAAIERGRHLAITRGCAECHAADFGGHMVMETPPIGRMAGPNLTPGTGSVTTGFTAQDWEHAIRHGVKPDGRGLLFMPTRDFSGLSDADSADLIAFLQQLPPIDRALAPSYVGPIGRALFAFGQLPLIEARLIDQHALHPVSMLPAPDAEYGRYLAQACTGCHGEHFSGGAIPGVPPDFPKPRNITPDVASGIGNWSKTDFYRALREGKRPDGSALDPFMPWKAMRRFSDTELDALWAYLQSIPSHPAGGR